MPSTYTESEKRGEIHGTDVAFDTARVVESQSHTAGDTNQHQVKIQIDPKDPNSAIWATVHTQMVGDVSMPVEGDIVRVAYEKGDQPVVLGTRYQVENGTADSRLPEYGPGQRTVTGGPRNDTPSDDAHLTFYPDGTTELQPTPGKPLILGGGTKQVFLFKDFQYQPDETFYPIPWDKVETRLLSQSYLDEHSIGSEDDIQNLSNFDEQRYEWVIPTVDSEWIDPDPRGQLWTVEATVRFELVQQGTVCEVGLFIREQNDGPSQGQLVESRTVSTANQTQSQGAVTVPMSVTERFPQQSRLSLHVRSKNGGGTISSNALTVDRSPWPIESDTYGEVENWDGRYPRVRQTNFSITRGRG